MAKKKTKGKAVAQGRRAISPMVRIDLKIPRDVLHQLKLIRSITGVHIIEWCRWQVTLAAQMELARRPGALWLRPGTRVYRFQRQEDSDELVPLPVATALGGERVWIMDVIPDVFAPLGVTDELWSLDADLRWAGVYCDLSADEPGQVELKRVVVSVVDVLPRDSYPWRSGLGSMSLTARRERFRERLMASRQLARMTAAMKSLETAPPGQE